MQFIYICISLSCVYFISSFLGYFPYSNKMSLEYNLKYITVSKKHPELILPNIFHLHQVYIT